MSWQMWVFLIFGPVAALIATAAALYAWKNKDRTKPARYRGDDPIPNPPTSAAATSLLAGCVFLVALLVLMLGCFTVVGTRQVGIATSFSKPTGQTFSNGLHFKAPWVEVTEMDAAVQNDVYNGDHRIQVRLGNNSTALADVNIRWQIRQEAADELFQQYKTFDSVRSNLVERNLRTALNEAFANFDPLSTDPALNNLTVVGVRALTAMRVKSGDQVEILDLSIPVIDYDDKTEERINAINAAIAETRKAVQDKATADQRAAAARILSQQPVPNLSIAIAACVNKMAESGQNLNCFPIGGTVVPTLSVPNPAG